MEKKILGEQSLVFVMGPVQRYDFKEEDLLTAISSHALLPIGRRLKK